MSDTRRLKRGLQDVSPLFAGPSPVPNLETARPEFVAGKSEVSKSNRFISLSSPEAPQDSLFFNSFFAAQAQALGEDTALLTLQDEKTAALKPESFQKTPGAVKKFVIKSRQFDAICASKLKSAESFKGSMLFFDFNISNPFHFSKVIPLLDQWVLFLSPKFESLSEGYRTLKSAVRLNPSLEYFIGFQGPPRESGPARLFEGFSEIVSRRLGVHLNWLGQWDPDIPLDLEGMNLANLESPRRMDSLEKRAFARIFLS